MLNYYNYDEKNNELQSLVLMNNPEMCMASTLAALVFSVLQKGTERGVTE